MSAGRPLADAIPRGRQRLYAAVVALATVGLCLVAIETVLSFLGDRAETSDRLDRGLVLHDGDLGWRLAPDWNGRHRHHDFEVRYSTNRYGYRGDFAEAFAPAKARRFAVLGDSFTFGFGVNDGETFVDHLNRGAGPDELFLNFGVPGYSTDQQLLQMARALSPFRITDFVVVVYLANDLIDNTLDFPIQAPAAKPYFELERGRLLLKNHPAPQQQKGPAEAARTFASIVLAGVEPPGSVDRWIGGLAIVRRMGIQWPPPVQLFPAQARRFAPSLDLFTALAQAMRETAARRGARLHIVLLGGRSFVADRGGYSAQYQEHVRSIIVERSGPAGLRVLDLASYLRSQDPAGRLYYPYEGHLTAQGNRVAAEWLSANLRRDGQ